MIPSLITLEYSQKSSMLFLDRPLGGFLAVIRPYLINPNFMYLVMLSPYMQNQMRDTASQTTNIANISLKGMRPIPVPIPPLDDQVRIVAKVNELMALCEKLETQQQEREVLCKLTARTALQALASASTLSELKVAWSRVEAHTPLFLDTIENIQSYKGAILDLAMHGLLVAPEDRSASTGADLLFEISHRRTMWTKTTEGQERKEAITMQKKV